MLICDEVQSGFGRTGTHFWAHQKLDAVPDIVTMGKPMANGHPVGAVVTTPEMMATFRNGFRYFNTFGGNPVSCAAAMAVLDEMDAGDLMNNAADVGDYARSQMEGLAQKHAMIGNVRGMGLVFGAEMVLDHTAKTPATAFTDRVINAMRERGVLLSKLGRYRNTLKIRPPMPFSMANVDHLISTLDDVLAETPLEP